MCSMAMGTEPDLTGAGGVDDTDQRHLEDRGDSGSGAKPANSSRTSSSYWYTRAHRALRQRLSDPGQLLREYQHVLALDAAHAPHCRIAAGAAAAGRNRYCNVLPYDDNRVVLTGRPAPGYINASPVDVALPGRQPARYVATQGPLPSTVADFWHMVWQLRAPAVVMLTPTTEGGTDKCAQYFPDAAGKRLRLPDYQLTVEECTPFSSDCTLRLLKLAPAQAAGGRANEEPQAEAGASAAAAATPHEPLLLRHYQFTGWPDHGTPGSSAGLRALSRALAPVHSVAAPVVVHCSAGIGRTGTFIALDATLARLDGWPQAQGGSGPDRPEVEDTLNLPALVAALRVQRGGMVQTLEQYAWVYRALVDDLAARTAQARGSESGSGGDDHAA